MASWKRKIAMESSAMRAAYHIEKAETWNSFTHDLIGSPEKEQEAEQQGSGIKTDELLAMVEENKQRKAREAEERAMQEAMARRG